MEPKRLPDAPPEPRRALIALLAPVLLAAALAWLAFGSFDQLMLALDRASALGPCHGPDGAKPLCDFANHYYPQGQALSVAPVVVPGFYYSAFFAVLMRLWAAPSYGIAAGLWAMVVVAAALTLILARLSRWEPWEGSQTLPRRSAAGKAGWRGRGRSPRGGEGVRWSRSAEGLRTRSLLGAAVHGLLFALALPLWHDLAFGQVSSLLTALVLLSFLAHCRDRPVLAGLLLGLAASIKFYPAFFAVYFVLRRDRRALLAFAGTFLCCSAILPLIVLGEAGLVAFYRSLWTSLESLSGFVGQSPFANFVANAFSGLLTGHIDPTSIPYQVAVAAGLGVAGLHVFLVWRLVRRRPEGSAWPSLLLGFATLPFVVRSCWVHYFVFLPLLQGYVGAGDPRMSRRTRVLLLGSAVLSVLLVSVPLLLLLGSEVYYKAAFPFWATALVLPGLYYRTWIETEPT
jgi:hypothetical protein